MGINYEHLVRPLVQSDIETYSKTDETHWDLVEISPWDDTWKKPDEKVLYEVVSGNHRTCAARLKGLKTIRCIFVDASDEVSFLDAAVASNVRQGKNFTTEDKKLLVMRYKAQGLGTSEIAKRFHVDVSTVKNWVSGRNANKAAQKKRQEAAQVITDEDGNERILDKAWQSLPDVTLDEQQLVKAARVVQDGIASTPHILDKSHFFALVRSLSLQEYADLLNDMQRSRAWWENAITLAEYEHKS